jgi:hypothetical protein
MVTAFRSAGGGSTTQSPVALVATADREGSSGPSQDRVFVGSWSVVVMDGASPSLPDERDGGWLADELGVALMARLEADERIDLAVAVRDSIAAVAERFDLVPGRAPSTTVSIARWSPTTVDILVLGDSPVAVRRRDRAIQVLRQPASGDWILGELRGAVRAAYPADQLEAILMVTDGAAAGVDFYGTPPDWSTAIDMALDPQALLDAIHALEADDALGSKWPRPRLHDDKALARITLL